MNKVLENIIWLVFDRIFVLVLQFVIGVKIANYYGSEQYGLYHYVAAIMAFSSIFYELLNPRIIKQAYAKDQYPKIIYHVNYFRNVISILVFVLCLFSRYFVSMNQEMYLMMILMAINGMISSLVGGIESFLEYKLEARSMVIINNLVRILGYILQYLGIISGGTILYIPIIAIITNILRVFLVKNLYNRKYEKIKKISFQKNLLFNMIQESFFLWISFISFLVYTQLDKIMLGKMLGVKEVGVYSIALSLSNMTIIAITAMTTSVFPSMLSLFEKDYAKYLEKYQLYTFLMTQLYLFGGIVSYYILKLIFPYLFNPEYLPAVEVYAILMVSILFKANACLQTAHITLKKKTKLNFIKTLSGLFLNVLLNFYFIKHYGIYGAAIATSITSIFTLFVVDFFIPSYNEHAWIQLWSFTPRYLSSLPFLRRKG